MKQIHEFVWDMHLLPVISLAFCFLKYKMKVLKNLLKVALKLCKISVIEHNSKHNRCSIDSS